MVAPAGAEPAGGPRFIYVLLMRTALPSS